MLDRPRPVRTETQRYLCQAGRRFRTQLAQGIERPRRCGAIRNQALDRGLGARQIREVVLLDLLHIGAQPNLLRSLGAKNWLGNGTQPL